MDRDTIIRLAREAGLYPHVEWGGMFYVTSGFLENFAVLVAAHEREACAKVCEDEGERIDASWMSCAAAIRSRT